LSTGSPLSGAGTPIAQAVDAANQQGVPVTNDLVRHTVGRDPVRRRPSRVPQHGALLAQIASDTGGTSFQAATGDELRRVYQDVGRRITLHPYQRDLTMLFIGVALASPLSASHSLVARPASPSGS